jgi:hypothetical protein
MNNKDWKEDSGGIDIDEFRAMSINKLLQVRGLLAEILGTKVRIEEEEDRPQVNQDGKILRNE